MSYDRRVAQRRHRVSQSFFRSTCHCGLDPQSKEMTRVEKILPKLVPRQASHIVMICEGNDWCRKNLETIKTKGFRLKAIVVR